MPLSIANRTVKKPIPIHIKAGRVGVPSYDAHVQRICSAWSGPGQLSHATRKGVNWNATVPVTGGGCFDTCLSNEVKMVGRTSVLIVNDISILIADQAIGVALTVKYPQGEGERHG